MLRERLIRGAAVVASMTAALTAGSCEVPQQGSIVLPPLGSPITHLVAGKDCPTGKACATFDVPLHTAFAVEANDAVTVSVNGQTVPMVQGDERLAQQNTQVVVDNLSDTTVKVAIVGPTGTDVVTIDAKDSSKTPPDFLHPTTDAIESATQYVDGVTLAPTATHQQPARRDIIQGGQQKFAVVAIVNQLSDPTHPSMLVVLSGASADSPAAATK